MNNKKNNNKSAGGKKRAQQSILEMLRGDDGSNNQGSSLDQLRSMPKDFMDQLFGPMPVPNRSVELKPGEQANMQDVMSGQHEENQRLKAQLAQERYLRQEEDQLRVRQINEQKQQLKSIDNEVKKMASATVELDEQLKIAAMQEVSEDEKASKYTLFRLNRLLKLIQDFVVNIKEASVWLKATNSRKKKKGAFWGQYHSKKQGGGAATLLNTESYSSRSAG